MKNIDPYNNLPPPRPGAGGCSTGKCGVPSTPMLQAMQKMQASYPQPQQQPLPPRAQPNLMEENRQLYSDLEVAVNYIRQLGGLWPPPTRR